MESLSRTFFNTFKEEAEATYSCGGRFEILGNHTDHNHGCCLAATCSLAITAAIKKCDNNIVSIYSKGYETSVINLNSLEMYENEKESSSGLVRGIAKYLLDHGYKIGGFEMVSESTIFPGAGVSSSAAFELLIAQLFNDLYNEGKIEKMVLCKAGQWAENVYFGKKSGLLDQIGVAYGNIVAIDFKDIEKPIVKEVEFPFDDLHFVIVNTGGSHAELSDLYSSIPMDMRNAANKMGCDYLIEGSLDKLVNSKSLLTDSEFDRSLHFYFENERVNRALLAIENKEENAFLAAVNGSRESSTKLLKNMMVGNHYEGSPLEATDIAMRLMHGEGAAKINGGGFAGSIICVVPEKRLSELLNGMKEKYGSHNVQEVFVRKTGPVKE